MYGTGWTNVNLLYLQDSTEVAYPQGARGTYHVCIRGRGCHVFGSGISLENHILGSKISKHECPIFGG